MARLPDAPGAKGQGLGLHAPGLDLVALEDEEDDDGEDDCGDDGVEQQRSLIAADVLGFGEAADQHRFRGDRGDQKGSDDGVAGGELDLAVVTMGDESISRLEAHKLTSYDLVYCVGPKHPLAGEKTVSLAQTAQYPMILFSGGYYQKHLLDSSFRALGLVPNILFRSNQLMTIKSFIRQDIASGFLMTQVLQEEDGIIPIPVREDLKLNVAVVWRKDDYLTREADRFVSFCRRTFEAR